MNDDDYLSQFSSYYDLMMIIDESRAGLLTGLKWAEMELRRLETY